MNHDPIANQIEGIGYRRLAGRAGRFVAVFLAGCVLLGWVVRHTRDKGIRAAVALALCGLLFGYASSVLATSSRKLLIRVFVLVPLVVSLSMFAFRTLFGRAEELPLRLVLAPLALALGFLLGVGRRFSP